MYRLRQAVIKSRGSPAVARGGAKAVALLNELYEYDKDAFTAEDIRFANVLRGYLGERLAAPAEEAAHQTRRNAKGDKLENCWRCRLPLTNSSPRTAHNAAKRPISGESARCSNACGCQRAGKVLI